MSDLDVLRCSALNSAGEPCKNRPIRGGEVCSTHGGSAPQVKVAAKRRLLETRIRGQLEQREIEPVTNPLAVMAQLAGERLAWLDFAREQVAFLQSLDYRDLRGVEDVKAVAQVYQEALREAFKAAHDMARIGLDAETLRRQLQIETERPSREQAEALQRIMEYTLSGIGLTDEQLRAANERFPEAVQREQAK